MLRGDIWPDLSDWLVVMPAAIKVYKNRTTTVTISMGVDVSGDVITSQIRAKDDASSALIAEWDVAFLTNGSDGELVLTIDSLIASEIQASRGYMDLKRVSGGEPLPVFEMPLDVIFQGAVTT